MATPLETNTEELQKILQQVYDLPNKNSEGSSPDLVISLDTSEFSTINGRNENLSFDSSEVITAYNKLLSGETAKCVLNAKYHIHSGPAVAASSPQITAFAMSEDGNSARVGQMSVFFNLWYSATYTGTLLIEVVFNIHGDNTASLDYVGSTKSVSWASAYM